MIPDSFKQELLHRVDIVDVIERHVPLKKGGANFLACCPFHSEKTPSFSVSPAKQFYHCFGCGVHGNAISFLMEYSGLGYVDAVRELAEGVGMKMPELEPRAGKQEGPDLLPLMQRASDYYREQLKQSPRAVDYLKARGLTGKVAARFGIGYAPAGWQNLQAVFPAAPDGKGASYGDKALKDAGLVIDAEGGRRYDRFRERIMFPILDQRGSVIAFGGRVLEPALDDRDPGPKYLNSPETPLFEKGRELYGLSQARQAIRAAGRVLVVEGYMDVVALAQYGIDYAVATLGTATSAVHVQRLLRQTDEIVFSFDGDAAGRKAAWKALEVSLPSVTDTKIVKFLFLPPEHDPDSFVRERGVEAFEELLRNAQSLAEFFVEGLRERFGTSGVMEGKSHVFHEAKAFLQPLAAMTLKQNLLKHVAQAYQMREEEAARDLGLRIAGTTPFPRYGRVPAREERAPMQSLEVWLLKRLMVKPSLAHELPGELLRGQTFESLALQVFVAFARETAGANFDALVIDRFHGTEFEGLFKQIKKEVMVMALSPEDVEVEFRDALPNMELQHVKDRLTELVRQADLRKLTPAEEAQLGRLAARRKELDVVRNGPPPVI